MLSCLTVWIDPVTRTSYLSPRLQIRSLLLGRVQDTSGIPFSLVLLCRLSLRKDMYRLDLKNV